MTGCCELANELTALSAVGAIPLEGFAIAAPEHTALAHELTALSAVGAIIAPEHTALTNELTALIALDTNLILGHYLRVTAAIVVIRGCHQQS